ncbi:MAG: DNA gyrase inhibitor YacG [Pseudomonadota bacterium]
MTVETQPKKISVRCPHCSGLSLWSAENSWRPFCSARCKDIDLGAWAAESYRVPVSLGVDELLSLGEHE